MSEDVWISWDEEPDTCELCGVECDVSQCPDCARCPECCTCLYVEDDEDGSFYAVPGDVEGDCGELG